MSKRWYVVHTYSGYENRVKSDLEHRIETMGMQDRIFDIQIPTERETDQGGAAPKRAVVDIEVGTSVRVISGPLSEFDGKVSEVMPEAAKVKVTLMIFGREPARRSARRSA